MYYFCLFFLLSVFSFFNYCGMIDWNFARIHRRTRSTSFRVVCAQRERRAHELQAMELIIVERSVTGGLCSSQKARFQAISPICSTERPCLSCLAWTCRPGGVLFYFISFFSCECTFSYVGMRDFIFTPPPCCCVTFCLEHFYSYHQCFQPHPIITSPSLPPPRSHLTQPKTTCFSDFSLYFFFKNGFLFLLLSLFFFLLL